jgi:hypothetical protein
VTAPALDHFGDLGEVGEMAASHGVGGSPRGQSAVAEAPSVRNDVAGTFPELAFDGGKLLRVRGGCGEYSVPSGPVRCVLCEQVVEQIGTDDKESVAIVDGSCHWIHTECGLKLLGHRDRIQGWHEPIDHADCAVCGRPWDDHRQYGYPTLVCPTWDGDAATVPLYQHAPGHVGPLREPWVVIAGEDPCGCHEQSMEQAA